MTPTPPRFHRKDPHPWEKVNKDKPHRLIWCPVRGWRTETWCKENRDPQQIGECYHCLRTRKLLKHNNSNSVEKIIEN